MDFNRLNRCSFSLQSRYPDGKFCGIFHSQCASVSGICVRRGVRKMLVDLVMWGIVINFVIVIKNT